MAGYGEAAPCADVLAASRGEGDKLGEFLEDAAPVTLLPGRNGEEKKRRLSDVALVSAEARTLLLFVLVLFILLLMLFAPRTPVMLSPPPPLISSVGFARFAGLAVSGTLSGGAPLSASVVAVDDGASGIPP